MFHEAFDVQPDCPPAELDRAARTSVALDRLVENHGLGSLAYYYMGVGKPGERGCDQLDHPGQLAADGARHSGGRRDGDQERPGDEDPRHASAPAARSPSTTPWTIATTSCSWATTGRGTSPSPRGRPRSARSRSITARSGAGCRWRCRCGTARSRCLSSWQTVDGRSSSGGRGRIGAGPILEIGNTNSRYRFPSAPAVRRRSGTARPGPPLRRRRRPPGVEDRKAGQPAGDERHAGVLSSAYSLDQVLCSGTMDQSGSIRWRMS